jgi:phosphonate transport system substrate-binding protein
MTREKELGLMSRRLPVKLIALVICCSWLVASVFAAGTPKPIKIAILPCNNIEITFKKFYPLVRYLRQQTKLEIRLVVPADFLKFETSVKKGDIDFALQDPHTYIMLAKQFNNDSLLSVILMDGKTTYSAAVVVRKNSHLRNIQDLRGKSVMFGSKASITKWLAAKLLFAENGINIDNDLKSYVNGGCCEDIAFSVFLKSVDAGVVCEHFLKEHENRQKELGLKADEITVIGRTKSVPSRVFGARKDVSPEIISKINQALLRLDRNNPEHAKILYRGELGGFQRAQAQDYEGVRKLMAIK